MSSRPSRGAARLAAILDALPDALVLVNANGTVVNANTIALEAFETPGTALVGRGLLDLLPEFDSKLIPGSMRRPDHTDPRGRTRPTRMTARRTDGSEFPVEVTSANLENSQQAYDGNGYSGDELLMLVVRDLSGTVDTEAELARSQRQTEMILRAAAEGVVGTDTDGRIVLVNPAAAQILGYRAGELGGRELHTLVLHSRADGSPFPYGESPLADTLRSGRKHRVRGQVLWSKAGDKVSVDLTTAPVRDGDQLVGAVMTFTDRRPYDALADEKAADEQRHEERLDELVEEHASELTALRQKHVAEIEELTERHEEQLAANEERYAALGEREKDRYEALAARHEQLLTLLGGSLRGPLDELRRELAALAADDAGQLWPEANQVLHHLSAGYARITTLIDNVLGYQRLDAGSEEIVRTNVMLDAVVAAGVDGAVELIGPGRVQFAVHAPPIEAEVDPRRLATALAHLVADVAGVDATGNSPVSAGGYMDNTVVVAAAQRGEVVRIEVRGPYAGGDPVHEPIVRGIVRAHGGVLQTHEVPGMSGSAYVLEVPLGGGAGVVPAPAPAPVHALEPAAVPAEPAPAEPAVPEQPAGGGRRRARRSSTDAFLDSDGDAETNTGAPAAPTGRRRRRAAEPPQETEQVPAQAADGSGGTGRRRGRSADGAAGVSEGAVVMAGEHAAGTAASGTGLGGTVPPQGVPAPAASTGQRQTRQPEALPAALPAAGDAQSEAAQAEAADGEGAAAAAQQPTGRRRRALAAATERAAAQEAAPRPVFALPPAAADRPAAGPEAAQGAVAMAPLGSDGQHDAVSHDQADDHTPPQPHPTSAPTGRRRRAVAQPQEGAAADVAGATGATPAQGAQGVQGGPGAGGAAGAPGVTGAPVGAVPVPLPGAPAQGAAGAGVPVQALPGGVQALAQAVPQVSAGQPAVPAGVPQGVPVQPVPQQVTPGQPVAPQGMPGQPAVPQGVPGQPAVPQGVPGQPAAPQGVPAQSAAPQGAPGQPVPQQVAPGQPVTPQALPGQPAAIQGLPGQPVAPQGMPGQPAVPQGAPGQPAAPQGLPGQPAMPPGAPGQLAAPQGVPGQPVTPQGVPGQLAAPQGVPGQPVTPQGVPGQPVAPQSLPAQTVEPQAVPGHPAPQGAPGQPVAAQVTPGQPVTPQGMPGQPAASQALSGQPAMPQGAPVPGQPPAPQMAPGQPVTPQGLPGQPVTPQGLPGQPAMPSAAPVQPGAAPQVPGQQPVPGQALPAPHLPGQVPSPEHAVAGTVPAPALGIAGQPLPAQPPPLAGLQNPGAQAPAPQPPAAPLPGQPVPAQGVPAQPVPAAQPVPGVAGSPVPPNATGAPLPPAQAVPQPAAPAAPGVPAGTALPPEQAAGQAAVQQPGPGAAVPRAAQPLPAEAAAPVDPHSTQGRAISVRTLGQGVPFVRQAAQAQAPQPPSATPPPQASSGSGRRRKLGTRPDAAAAPQQAQTTPAPMQAQRPEQTARPHPSAEQPPAQPSLGGPVVAPATEGGGRSYAIGAPDENAAEGPEPLDGPGGAVEVADTPRPQPMDDELPPEPLDNPRRLLVWPAPDVTTQQALSDRGYRPVIVNSREEVDAQIAAFPAALFVDPLTGPITRTALQSLRQAAVAAEVPVLVTAGLGQATREAAYGADPAVLLKALAPRDSEQHPPRVLLIEEHAEIALALTATLERRGMQVARAASDNDAVTLAGQFRPNLVVMDLMQVHRRRAGILDWLRANGQLNRTPLVVYTATVDQADLPRLASGETVLFLAERSTSDEVQSRLVDLLARVGTN
ncbi:PAS domain-containing protein [Streptomyces sp. NPDC088817]|uniref:PAS domain-containing protein n=1 Tax=Streptomyces sp. NPDC088817 TaxID=3365907 RepID=UPI00382127A7